MTGAHEGPATVWAATWVPSPSPLAGHGESGYSVAWVDGADGVRRQVLVAGDRAPAPGSPGRLERTALDDVEVALFVPSDEAR